MQRRLKIGCGRCKENCWARFVSDTYRCTSFLRADLSCVYSPCCCAGSALDADSPSCFTSGLSFFTTGVRTSADAVHTELVKDDKSFVNATGRKKPSSVSPAGPSSRITWYASGKEIRVLILLKQQALHGQPLEHSADRLGRFSHFR